MPKDDLLKQIDEFAKLAAKLDITNQSGFPYDEEVDGLQEDFDKPLDTKIPKPPLWIKPNPIMSPSIQQITRQLGHEVVREYHVIWPIVELEWKRAIRNKDQSKIHQFNLLTEECKLAKQIIITLMHSTSFEPERIKPSLVMIERIYQTLYTRAEALEIPELELFAAAVARFGFMLQNKIQISGNYDNYVSLPPATQQDIPTSPSLTRKDTAAE